MALGIKQEKKVKDDALGYSFTHKDVIEVDNATASEVAIKFGTGVNNAVLTWAGTNESGYNYTIGITNTNGKTNIKLVTATKTYNMIAVGQLATAITDVINAHDILFVINRGGTITGYKNASYADTTALPKSCQFIPDGGVINEPILGISIDSTTANLAGTLTIYY